MSWIFLWTGIFSATISSTLAQNAIPLEVAVTFDDLPISGPQPSLAEIEMMTAQILASLTRFEVPATGLVNEGKLHVPGEEEARRALLSKWLAAGAELGNHTYSHPSLNRVSVEDFLQDILWGEGVIRELLQPLPLELHYFRYPYLHTGKEKSVRDKVRTFLTERDYRVAPVTLENSDWIFNVALLEARKRNQPELENRVKDAYLEFTVEIVDFLEKAAEKVVGRPIRHVLLLHANPINSLALSELLDQLRIRGYAFISLDRALRDPVYSRPENYLGPAGVNWIFRWDVEDADREVDWSLEPVPPNFVDQLYRPNE